MSIGTFWALSAVLAATLQVSQSPPLVAPAGPSSLIDTGPIQTLYRVLAWPSYFLIGADGSIKVSATGSNLDLERALRTLVP